MTAGRITSRLSRDDPLACGHDRARRPLGLRRPGGLRGALPRGDRRRRGRRRPRGGRRGAHPAGAVARAPGAVRRGPRRPRPGRPRPPGRRIASGSDPTSSEDGFTGPAATRPPRSRRSRRPGTSPGRSARTGWPWTPPTCWPSWTHRPVRRPGTQRALDLADTSTDPAARRWRGSLWNNIGWARFEASDLDGAMAAFETALAARREQGKPRETRVAEWCVARCLRALGRPAEALAIHERLAVETAAAGDPEDGYGAEEIAECLLAMGREEEARPHFARAADLLGADAWLAEHEPDRIARLRRARRGLIREARSPARGGGRLTLTLTVVTRPAPARRLSRHDPGRSGPSRNPAGRTRVQRDPGEARGPHAGPGDVLDQARWRPHRVSRRSVHHDRDRRQRQDLAATLLGRLATVGRRLGRLRALRAPRSCRPVHVAALAAATGRAAAGARPRRQLHRSSRATCGRTSTWPPAPPSRHSCP